MHGRARGRTMARASRARGAPCAGDRGAASVVDTRVGSPVSGASVSGLTVGAFQENCYLVAEPGGNRCVIIDPGDEPERIIAAVERSGADPEAIWLTHAHLDHIGAISALRRRWDIPVYLHPLDDPLYAL